MAGIVSPTNHFPPVMERTANSLVVQSQHNLAAIAGSSTMR
ncbi:hypothetical protein GCM10010332_74070 [Streptomyces albogriseolus]|nr:hypothetical protein GCM10010332_74070 [Streptomyces albogriseolus]